MLGGFLLFGVSKGLFLVVLHKFLKSITFFRRFSIFLIKAVFIRGGHNGAILNVW